MNALLVFVGGGLGALVRYGIAKNSSIGSGGFPWPTFWANTLACVILAVLVFGFPGIPEKYKLGIGTGLCGGLSTFSTFSLESQHLLQQGQVGIMLVYILASVLCCLTIFLGAYFLFR